VNGNYRLRTLEFLAGVNRTVGYYKEFGCTFKVDVARTYFSPRLSTERGRIAKLVKEYETVANLFGGVGTFSILMSRARKTARVYSIDSNIFAFNLCAENCIINRVKGRVIPLFGDATNVTRIHLAKKCTRVLMPLPERAREFVDVAISCLVNGKGIIHYFSHVNAHDRKDALEKASFDVGDAFKLYRHSILCTRVVREVGPRVYQIVCDVSTHT